MCEHCRKNLPPTKEVVANFSYKKVNEIESEARVMISRALTQEEFEDALNQLLISMKVYSEKSCGISDKAFKDMVRRITSCSFENSPNVFESGVVSFADTKAPILYN